MNKLTIASLALVFVTILACAQALSQSKCSLTAANSPSIHGLRLGMSAEQVLALFPGSTKRWAEGPFAKDMKNALEKARATTTDEPVYLSFEPATDAAKDELARVDSVSVAFRKGSVVDFSLLYAAASWRTIDEWVAKLLETFKLAGAQDWVVGPNEAPNRVLKCDGIEIEAAIQGGSASFRIRNTEYLKGMEERTRAADEKKRRDLKP